MTASGCQLATNHSIADRADSAEKRPSPTLAAFKNWWAQKRFAFFIASGRDGFMGNSNSRTSAQICPTDRGHFGSGVDGIQRLITQAAPKGGLSHYPDN